MKLNKEDIVRVEDDSPLELFRQGIKSKVTAEKYTRTLRQILCKILENVLTGTFEERVQQLVNMGREDPRWVRDLLLNLSKKLRERTELDIEDKEYLNPDTVGNYFKPIKKLFDMNDIAIPWKRIYATYPERDNMADSRGWTRQEIALMLKHAHGPLDRALVLVLASSGMRAGGLDLIWEDLTAVYRMADGSLVLDPGKDDSSVACAVLRVYRGSPESYLAFITPEAFDALQVYGRTWVKQRCHLPRPKDPIFLVQNGAHKNASVKILRDRVARMATKAGLRGAKESKRFEVPAMNGFRRFWNKTCKETASGDSLASLIKKEYMMGHQGLVSLDQNYFKTNLMELATEYIKVVPDLTIEDSERLRQSNRTMSSNIQKLESEKDEKLERLTRKVDDMRRERDSMRQEIFELKKQRESPAMDLLDALKKHSGTDGISEDVLGPLTSMMHQLTAMHKNDLEEIRREYGAEIDRLKRAADD
ncbi:MAG: integrase [Cenarchaeum sp. SB0661_bin_35]|nr:integrase [Cenarchaeum sp. SB0667_bin_13]MYC79198.1 integrase [Cenarchaeum sp. SB0661_bin_35]MYI51457.1 integrase [Cenarchaeum sp. SB0673_bin_9]